MGRIGTFPMLAILAAVAWIVPAGEVLYYGEVSAVSVVTASMFTAMIVAWPMLNNRRLMHGREKAMMCRDCHGLRWPNEGFGFCIHCGCARPAVRMTY